MAIDLSYLKELVSARDELERRMKEEREANWALDPVIGFGKHKNQRCSEVPFGYLKCT